MFCRTLSKYTRLITDPQITKRMHSSDFASNLFLPIFNKNTFLLLVLILLVSMNYPNGIQLRFLKNNNLDNLGTAHF